MILGKSKTKRNRYSRVTMEQKGGGTQDTDINNKTKKTLQLNHLMKKHKRDTTNNETQSIKNLGRVLTPNCVILGLDKRAKR